MLISISSLEIDQCLLMHMHVSTTLTIWRVSFLWIGCRKCKSKLCFALYRGIIRAAIFHPAMLCTIFYIVIHRNNKVYVHSVCQNTCESICVCGCRPSCRWFVVGFGYLTVQWRCCRNLQLTLLCSFVAGEAIILHRP